VSTLAFAGAIIGALEREVKMRRIICSALLGGVALLSIAIHSQQGQPTRIGMLIGIKPDRITAYEALHAASNQGVRDFSITSLGITNTPGITTRPIWIRWLRSRGIFSG
jgi:hypothetical protein